jgi:nuclear transport factor 2 (NTF2) superfamily protein
VDRSGYRLAHGLMRQRHAEIDDTKIAKHQE